MLVKGATEDNSCQGMARHAFDVVGLSVSFSFVGAMMVP